MTKLLIGLPQQMRMFHFFSFSPAPDEYNGITMKSTIGNPIVTINVHTLIAGKNNVWVSNL